MTPDFRWIVVESPSGERVALDLHDAKTPFDDALKRGVSRVSLGRDFDPWLPPYSAPLLWPDD